MFSEYKIEVQKQFNKMKNCDAIYRTKIDKDEIWNLYLSSFREGANPKFRERTEHDCSCCKQFIRAVGDMVVIINGKLESLWDVKTIDTYQPVTDALSEYVKSKPIENIFLHYESKVGTDKNYEKTETGVLTWEHFYLELPDKMVAKKTDIGPRLSDFRSTYDVMLRSLNEISIETVETVLELIAQNSLYRGEEHKFVLESFLKLKKEFNKLKSNAEKEIFCWSKAISTPISVSRIRNTVIGSLLVDLSEGKDLEEAVKSFESKVAPTNYKRPTALITKSMIENAQKKIEELGLTTSLERRYATIEDITINNVLFADRDAKKKMTGNVFDDISDSLAEKTQNFDKIEEINIEKFMKDVLPKVNSIEVLFENKHSNNLVSLIAPVNKNCKHMFKWTNNFSWSYMGDLTDSIKERVKSAGGNVNGDLRCSLSWFNHDDLDLHMIEPDKFEIYYGRKTSRSGILDVDMNAGRGTTRSPVENIVYIDKHKMKEGIYDLFVHQFAKRETIDVGFEVEVEFDNIIHLFSYSKSIRQNEIIKVAQIKYTTKEGFKILKYLPSSQSVKEVWGIKTQGFYRVSTIMNSPNHWDGMSVGNKHYFFMIDGCINDGKARGFYNEFLNEELNSHRKVLEVVGSKMKTEESQNQLSGLGFSSTQRNSIICRVKGSFNRNLKIIF